MSSMIRMPRMKTKPTATKVALSDVDAFFLLPDAWKEVLKSWSENPIECDRCGMVYYEINNIGKWNCRQHPLPWNLMTKGKFYGHRTWDCCGSNKFVNPHEDPRGCVRADHSPLNVPYELGKDDMFVPQIAIDYIRAKRRAVVSLDTPENVDQWTPELEPGQYIVRRFDWREDMHRRSYGMYGPARATDNEIYSVREQ